MPQYVVFVYEDGVYRQIDDRRFFKREHAQEVAAIYQATARRNTKVATDCDPDNTRAKVHVQVLKLDDPIPSEGELIPVHKFSGGIEETHYYPKELMPSVCYWSTRDLWQWIYREGHDECITGLEGREELIKIIEACITEM